MTTSPRSIPRVDVGGLAEASARHSVRRFGVLAALAGVALLFAAPAVHAQDEQIITFRRGDVDNTGSFTLSDAIGILNYLFLSQTPVVNCDRAFDINDDGAMSLSDPLGLLQYLFLSGATPAAPFPDCGADETPDALTCVEYAGCEPIIVEPEFDPVLLAKMSDVAHTLRRIAFGQTPELFDRVMAMENGVEDYMAEQLDPESIDESSNDALNDALAGLDPDSDLNDLYRLQVLRAVYSERQLQEVLTDFWDNHFNTYVWKLWYYFIYQQTASLEYVYTSEEALQLATYFEYQENAAFRNGALGVFEDLLVTSATSVSMLVYLDNIVNIVGNPNENYAREIMELHTLGAGNLYTQTDIVAVAKIFTGWGVCLVDEDEQYDPHAECQTITSNPAADGLVWAFHFFPDRHDYTAKTVFDGTDYEYTVAAGTMGDGPGGLAEGMEFIAHHAQLPPTAEYVSRKLNRRLVNDVEPGVLVAGSISTWEDTGGDLREVVETIITNYRFLGGNNRNIKMKTPSEYAISTIRAYGGDTHQDCTAVINLIATLGNLYFNYGTPDGYPEKTDDQLGTASFLERFKFAKSLYLNDDGLDFLDVKTILEDHEVPLEDAEEVALFWMRRMFGESFSDIDVELAIEFLTSNDSGVDQDLDSESSVYTTRIRKFLAFLSGYPQHVKQ